MNKTRLWAVALLACVSGPSMALAPNEAAAAFRGGPSVTVSINNFHDSLQPYGTWVDTRPYGRAWEPAHVGADWRPYSDGYWTYTDYGWTWVDNEPWGWGPYHYGRWFFDDQYGWLWVPGTTWAPAWVAWNECDDYIGWAPLPPSGTPWTASINSRQIPSSHWCFVPTRSLVDRRLRDQIAPVSRNTQFLSRGRDLTHYGRLNGTPVNTGLAVATFQQRTGHTVPRSQAFAAGAPARGAQRQAPQQRLTRQPAPVLAQRPAVEQRPAGYDRAPRGQGRPQSQPVPRREPAPQYVPPRGRPQQPNVSGGPARGPDRQAPPPQAPAVKRGRERPEQDNPPPPPDAPQQDDKDKNNSHGNGHGKPGR
jgi:hypothetical protein